MKTSGGLCLLDTNIVLHMIRGSALAEAVDSRFHLRQSSQRPLVSVVSAGESLAFAKKRKWGPHKVDQLDKLLRQLVIADINNAPTLSKYADIDAYCQSHGLALSKNDLWIAATAAATESLLITADKDFGALHDVMLQRAYFDPRHYKPARSTAP